MRCFVITEPTTEALEDLLPVETACEFLRVDPDEDGQMVELLLKAVRNAAEMATGTALVPQTFRCEFRRLGAVLRESYSEIGIELPRAPVRSISSVTLLERDGTETAVTSGFRLRDDAILFTQAPNGNRAVDGFRVEFVAGYGTVGSGEDADTLPVPDLAKRALLLAVGDAFEHRETFVVGTIVGQLPESVMAHFAPLVHIDL